jgi:hypothetical protein
VAIYKSIREDKSGAFNLAHIDGANTSNIRDKGLNIELILASFETIITALKQTRRYFLFFLDNVDELIKKDAVRFEFMKLI